MTDNRKIKAGWAAGKAVGAFTRSPAGARNLADKGVQAVVHGVESHHLAESMTATLSPIREL